MEEKQYQGISQVIARLLDRGLVFRSPWLTVKEASIYCRLSESYLNALRSKGGGPRYVKQGRIVLYRREWVDLWLSAERKDQ